MKGVLRGRSAGRGCYGTAGRTTANLTALLHNPRSACAVDGAVNAAPSAQAGVRGIANCIHLHFHDIATQKRQGYAIYSSRRHKDLSHLPTVTSRMAPPAGA